MSLKKCGETSSDVRAFDSLPKRQGDGTPGVPLLLNKTAFTCCFQFAKLPDDSALELERVMISRGRCSCQVGTLLDLKSGVCMMADHQPRSPGISVIVSPDSRSRAKDYLCSIYAKQALIRLELNSSVYAVGAVAAVRCSQARLVPERLPAGLERLPWLSDHQIGTR